MPEALKLSECFKVLASQPLNVADVAYYSPDYAAAMARYTIKTVPWLSLAVYLADNDFENRPISAHLLSKDFPKVSELLIKRKAEIAKHEHIWYPTVGQIVRMLTVAQNPGNESFAGPGAFVKSPDADVCRDDVEVMTKKKIKPGRQVAKEIAVSALEQKYAARLIQLPPPRCEEEAQHQALAQVVMYWGLKEAVSPPGWKGTTEKMKEHPEIDNPWALSWYMKGKGAEPHYTEKGTKKQKYKKSDQQPTLPGLERPEALAWDAKSPEERSMFLSSGSWATSENLQLLSTMSWDQFSDIYDPHILPELSEALLKNEEYNKSASLEETSG